MSDGWLSASANQSLARSKFRFRRAIVLFFKFIIIVLAVTYLFHSDRLRLSDLHIANEGWPWVFAAALTIVVCMLASFVRYWLLLSGDGVKVPLACVMRIGCISWFFSLGGLGFFSGDAVKTGYLIRQTNNLTAVFSSTLLDRMLGFAGLLLLAILALHVAPSTTFHSTKFITIAAALYVMTGALALGVCFLAISVAFGLSIAGGLAVGAALAFVWLARASGDILPLLLVLFFAAGIFLLIAKCLKRDKVRELIESSLTMGPFAALRGSLLPFRRRTGILLVGLGLSILNHASMFLGLFFISRAIAIQNQPTLAQIWFAAPLSSVFLIPFGVSEAVFDALLRFCTAPNGAPIVGGVAIFLGFRVLTMLLGFIGLPFFLLGVRSHMAWGRA